MQHTGTCFCQEENGVLVVVVVVWGVHTHVKINHCSYDSSVGSKPQLTETSACDAISWLLFYQQW